MKTLKGLTLGLWGLLLVLTAGLAGEAHADFIPLWEPTAGSEIVDSGREGDISWQLTADGLLAFSGTGTLMYEYEYDWEKYKETVSAIRIGEGITGGGQWQFRGFTALTDVQLPSTVTEIGSYAFWDCSSLKSIEIPGQVKKIGSSAFCDCEALTRVSLPEGLQSIDYQTFMGCHSLTDIQIPSTVTEIGSYAFWNCDSLKSIEIPGQVKKIGGDAFFSCESLTRVGLPEGLETIGSTAFKNCSALTDLQIPSTVTEIGKYAFHGCSSLKDLSLPKGITYIGDEEFYDCAGLKRLVIPDGVTSIGNSAFSGCTGLESIDLPDSVQTLEDSNVAWGGTFENCASLKSIRIPAGVTRIGKMCFDGCAKLETIELPGTLTEVEASAFWGCRSLKTIYFTGTESQWDGLAVSLDSAPDCQVICLGEGAGTAAQNREDTSDHAAGLRVSQDAVCLDVGFYLRGSPGGTLSAALIEQQLNAIRPYSDTIRLYSASGEVNKAYALAKTLGFRVVGSAWLSGDKTADRQELDALVALCQKGLCCAAVVGSETLLRGDLTPAELVSDLSYVRERLTGTGIPVTTADTLDCLLQNTQVRNACDFIFANTYSYWGGISADRAAENFIASVEALKNQCPDKEVMISETGWPTQGETYGAAVPGEQAAVRYFAAVRQWAIESDTVVFWFDAADEPWKAAAEGAVGAHWGLFTKDCSLKPGYESLEFFRAAAAAAGLSNFQKTASVTGSPFADVRAADWYYPNVCAVYEYGLMNGTGNNRFSPAGTLTVAEAVTLACRLYTNYHGYNITFPAGENWYDGYVAYAKAVNLIEDDQFTNYNQPISRRDIAVLFARTMPETAFAGIHTVTAIPDVDKTSRGYASILQLYTAGILTGTDAAGSFSPEKTVTRGESAAIMTRMVDPALRK